MVILDVSGTTREKIIPKLYTHCYLAIAFFLSVASATPVFALPISPGDRLEVSIPNEKYFARVYEVNQQGALEIPYLGSVYIAGLEPEEVREKLIDSLVREGFFPPGKLQLSVQILKWAPIQVSVTGEVFQPGQVLINDPGESKVEESILPESRQVTGEYPFRRYLTNAIRAAGGILPTADVKQIILKRGYEERIVDLSGIFTGEGIQDIALMAGDLIIVPQANRFQPELARPFSPLLLLVMPLPRSAISKRGLVFLMEHVLVKL
jgi:polysaccharide export outer membrane protein